MAIAAANMNKAFRIICMLTAITMTTYCYQRFLLNESTSLVDFQVFGKRDQDIYPSISLCLYGPGLIKEDELQKVNITTTAKDYEMFLRGNVWDNKMATVNFDKVSAKLEQYLKSIETEYENNQDDDNNYDTLKQLYQSSAYDADGVKPEMPFYISYVSDKDKCYSMDLTDEILQTVQGNLLSSIKIRLEANIVEPKIEITIHIHYPKQLLRSKSVRKVQLTKSSDNSNVHQTSTLRFMSMKVIRRRNTMDTPCDENWRNYDDDVFRKMAESARCKPAHWQSLRDHQLINQPNCNSEAQMAKLIVPRSYTIDIRFLESFDPPCDQLQAITFIGKTDIEERGKQEQASSSSSSSKVSTDEHTMLPNTTKLITNYSSRTTTLLIKPNLENYEEILHVRAMNFES